MEHLLNCFSIQVLAHRQDQCSTRKNFKLTTSTSMPQQEQASDSSSGSDDAPEQ
jgi:hypothetical protein